MTPSPAHCDIDALYIAVWIEPLHSNGVRKPTPMSEAYTSLSEAAGCFFDYAEKATEGRVLKSSGEDVTALAVEAIIEQATEEAHERANDFGDQFELKLPGWVYRRLSKQDVLKIASLEYRNARAA
ncbi:MAG: hypothetical protein ACE37E_01080 [Hyphomicrobiales bacterium]